MGHDNSRWILWSKSQTEYHVRYNPPLENAWPQGCLQVDLIETRFIRTYAEAMNTFRYSQTRELEGTIIKAASSVGKMVNQHTK
jgi:hypothetical protein